MTQLINCLESLELYKFDYFNNCDIPIAIILILLPSKQSSESEIRKTTVQVKAEVSKLLTS